MIQDRRMYRTHEFAERAGVSVRALHYYDRLGLLKPRRRSGAGYRLYDDRDLERLEHIVALKFIGLPLKQIKALLDRELPIEETLRAQRRVLEQKRRGLDAALEAIGEAEKSLVPGERAENIRLKKIIEVMEMQTDPNWAMKYYDDDSKAKIEARRAQWTPELQAQCERDWTELIRDVEAALGEDPASEKAQALADRWKRLVEGFTGGDAGLTQGLAAAHADRANWPAGAQQRMAPFIRPGVWEFIQKAMSARPRG
jgi:DNA-binding transcriptional MerR regulator